MSIWGSTWREKNLFQENFCEIVQAVKDEDWLYVTQLMSELSNEQQWDIWYRLASYTRKAMKDNHCVRLSV